MKPFRSLRLRITLLCALLLTLCCVALAVTSNLSAIQMCIRDRMGAMNCSFWNCPPACGGARSAPSSGMT